jgi:hypothetical protein
VDEPETEFDPEPPREPRVYGEMPHPLAGVRGRAGTILGRSRAFFAYAATWIRTRVGTTRRVASLRRRSRALTKERRRLQLDLGAAAFAEDSARMQELRERMRAVDAELAATDAEAIRTREQARDHLARERLGIQRTEINRTVG